MRIFSASRILAALAIIAGLGLAAPEAFADINLAYSLSQTGHLTVTNTGLGPGNISTGTLNYGSFDVSITTNTTDPTGTGTGLGGNGTSPGGNPPSSDLNTTTFAINNETSTLATITIVVGGQNFTVGAGGIDYATFSATASSSHSTSSDNVVVSSVIDTTNTALPTGGTSIPTTIGTTLVGNPVNPSTSATRSYGFTNSGNSNTLAFTNPGKFSIGQTLVITLAGDSSVTITVNTTAVTPEPSSFALAGVGGLGVIGYGLRRRKARTA